MDKTAMAWCMKNPGNRGTFIQNGYEIRRGYGMDELFVQCVKNSWFPICIHRNGLTINIRESKSRKSMNINDVRIANAILEYFEFPIRVSTRGVVRINGKKYGKYFDGFAKIDWNCDKIWKDEE